jgi:hypothetical protein
MNPVHNKAAQTLHLTFFDGSEMDYRFDPGELSYDSDSGLILSFMLNKKVEGMTEFVLCPHSRFRSYNRTLAGFLAPFGLKYLPEEKLLQYFEKGMKRTVASFGLYTASFGLLAVVMEYLRDLEAKDSGYYSLNEAHELSIQRPIHMPRARPQRN